MSTRYSIREHDAEWIIQRELSYNDGVLQQQRRKTRANSSTSTPAAPRRVPALPAAKKQRAIEVLAGVAAGVGATQEEFKQVADMLGLREGDTLVTAYTALGNRRAPRGACPKCERPTIALRLDGTLISHTPEPGMRLNDSTRCPGSGQPARAAATVVPLPTRKAKPAKTTGNGGARIPDALPGRPLCQDDPELFFPPAYSETYGRQIRKARAVCRSCPIAEACLRYALDQGENFDGICAGTTPKERRELIAARSARLTEKATA
ncbi:MULTISPECIES: WhiB family transcriptional regulator [unclassified Nonomuraea]|uniref:WhiB family transcriptional regulator n=1 Tax=unclassified Nonomuraea TaxID=2593643 RepID=UPI0033F4B8FF